MNKTPKPLIIFGTGKMAELAHIYFEKDGGRKIAAFCIDRELRQDHQFRGLPLVDFENVETSYPPQEYDFFVAVAYTQLNSIRRQKFQEAKNKGYALASFISSKITAIAGVQTGENCFIFENQVFQPNCRVGDNVIIWSGNHFGHDCEIGAHTFIASHVVCCGGVKIGQRCFIGVNATLRDAITIADECIIGAGAIILNSTKEKEVYVAKATEKYPLDSEKFMKILDISK